MKLYRVIQCGELSCFHGGSFRDARVGGPAQPLRAGRPGEEGMGHWRPGETVISFSAGSFRFSAQPLGQDIIVKEFTPGK